MVAMKGVQLFKAGTYKVLDHRNGQWVKRRFGREHIDQMVANFQRHQSPGPNRQHKLAIVVGHVPGDVYDPTVPRHGDVHRVYREGDFLCYDANDVNPDLAEQIKAKRYDDLSAEIYDSPEEAGLDGKGLMLRRVAILGGDVPKVKGLNPQGLAKTLKFAEDCNTLLCSTFAEDPEMGRDDMMQILLDAGMAQEVLDTLDDNQLREIVKAVQSSGRGDEPGEPDGDEATPAASDTPADEVADEATAETPTDNEAAPAEETPAETPAEAPAEAAPAEEAPAPESEEPPAEAAETTSADDELPGEPAPESGEGDDDVDVGDDEEESARKYAEMCGGAEKWKKAHVRKFGEMKMASGASSNMTDQAATMSSFSEAQFKTMVDAAVKPIAEAINSSVREKIAATDAELKRQRVQMFCESELLIGRISPAEMDADAGPTIVDRLLAIDDKAKVHKFSENGRQRELTALDAELRAIRQRPIKYRDEGRKIASGVAGTVKFSESTEDARRAKFLSFAERCADDLKSAGETPEALADAWVAAKKIGDHAAMADFERAVGYTE